MKKFFLFATFVFFVVEFYGAFYLNKQGQIHGCTKGIIGMLSAQLGPMPSDRANQITSNIETQCRKFLYP